MENNRDRHCINTYPSSIGWIHDVSMSMVKNKATKTNSNESTKSHYYTITEQPHLIDY